LFLDVVVPTKVFGNAGRASKSGAPVLVWIYGGSYTFGSKTYWGNPAGLLAQAQSSTEKGIIFVAMNYRVS
jgi:carboxylesterase type B